jgi:hypothetical protein
VFLGIVACGASEFATPGVEIEDPAVGDPRGLPVLPEGNHLGLWPTYDVLPIGTAAIADRRLLEIRTAGMKVARVHVAWGDLEPSPGHFELDELHQALVTATGEGLAIHLLIETIDSDGFSLPPDLVDSRVEYGLRDGLRFDDPVILARFAALLDRVVPALGGHRVFAISVGNEPDNRLDDIPSGSAQGVAWIADVSRFLEAARARIHTQLPAVAVAITVAQGSLQKGVTILGPLIDAGDAAVFNYYCQDRDFQVKPASVVAAELDALEQLAGARPLILQELGCPAGQPGSEIGASEAAQAEFFAEVGRQLVSRPELRAAFGFQLVDWSPSLVAEITQALRDEGLDRLAAQYGETLSTIGFIRYDDGSPRPAWPVFVDAIAGLRR